MLRRSLQSADTVISSQAWFRAFAGKGNGRRGLCFSQSMARRLHGERETEEGKAGHGRCGRNWTRAKARSRAAQPFVSAG